MAKLQQELEKRKKAIEAQLKPYYELLEELREIEVALAAFKTCTGCRTGCDECRTGPYYR